MIGECLLILLSQEFPLKVKNTLTKSADDETKCYVNLHSTEKSIWHANYLTQYKKYLSGFTPGGVLQHTSLQIPQFSKETLLYPGPIFPYNAIAKSNTAEQFKDEMRSLCLFGLGETKHEKPQGGGGGWFLHSSSNQPKICLWKTLFRRQIPSVGWVKILKTTRNNSSATQKMPPPPPTRKMKLEVVKSLPNQKVDL